MQYNKYSSSLCLYLKKSVIFSFYHYGSTALTPGYPLAPVLVIENVNPAFGVVPFPWISADVTYKMSKLGPPNAHEVI